MNTSKKIYRLDENSIRQIAAGEVVERPASVVKELLENSLDAQSKKIALEIINGGKELIRVSDDGCGMTQEDAMLSLERHTTSKIRSAEDLAHLSTFGFRGEALPSIAAVSKMTLTTKARDEKTGFLIALSGGKITEKRECGRDSGTTVEVKELFFNTPARLKFLKSELSEKNKIFRTFEEIAIAHPQISFEVKDNNKSRGNYSARAREIERICDLWGEEFNSTNLVPLFFNHSQIKISGWISTPQFHQPTRNQQIFYVNRRAIVSRLLSHALYEAYRDCLPQGRHPVAIIFVDLDSGEVDVNVHPSKREVRFRNEAQIFECLYREIRLKRSQLSAPPAIFSVTPMNAETVPNSLCSSPTSSRRFSAEGISASEMEGYPSAQFSFAKGVFPQQAETGNSSLERGVSFSLPSPLRQSTEHGGGRGEGLTEMAKPRVLSQFHALYVIAEQGENLLIIDQHAAAERILYEKLRQAMIEEDVTSHQPLLIPFLWNLTLSQAQIIQQHLPIFQKLGFVIEPFGEKTFRILEMPAALSETNLKEVLDEMLVSLEKEKEPNLAIEEKMMHAACRAAIKANDALSHQELSELLQQLSRCANPHTCPHGRPTTLTISRQELDKKFGRT